SPPPAARSSPPHLPPRCSTPPAATPPGPSCATPTPRSAATSTAASTAAPSERTAPTPHPPAPPPRNTPPSPRLSRSSTSSGPAHQTGRRSDASVVLFPELRPQHTALHAPLRQVPRQRLRVPVRRQHALRPALLHRAHQVRPVRVVRQHKPPVVP